MGAASMLVIWKACCACAKLTQKSRQLRTINNFRMVKPPIELKFNKHGCPITGQSIWRWVD
jgi:hypothetical protein